MGGVILEFFYPDSLMRSMWPVLIITIKNKHCHTSILSYRRFRLHDAGVLGCSAARDAVPEQLWLLKLGQKPAFVVHYTQL